MNDEQLLRYARHILLDELGIEGQERLLAARVLIVGAGGLGSPAALYLATAGVGDITLADDVSSSNLQRQILHTTASVGRPKAESGRDMLAAFNRRPASMRASSACRARPCPTRWPPPTWCWTAPTTSPPATPSTAPASSTASRWSRAPPSVSTARSASARRQGALLPLPVPRGR